MKKVGCPTYQIEYEELLVIVSDNVEVGHSLLFYCPVVAMQLQNVVRDVKSQCGDNDILQTSYMRYFQEVIKRVNKKEDGHEDQKVKNRTEIVKLLSLSNTKYSQSDPRLAWIMFHKIASMYREGFTWLYQPRDPSSIY